MDRKNIVDSVICNRTRKIRQEQTVGEYKEVLGNNCKEDVKEILEKVIPILMKEIDNKEDIILQMISAGSMSAAYTDDGMIDHLKREIKEMEYVIAKFNSKWA